LTSANTYGGNTTVNAGTLALGVSGSINNSPIINVAGGIFDVSAVSSYILGGSQTLEGSGTINGSVATASGANIFPATDGTTGTLAFNNNLNMSSGGTCHFDLGPTAAGANDLITVGGTLTLNGNTFHIKASSLETANDYVLISSANPVSGTVNATPTFDVVPPGSANYTIQISGNNVFLHYSSAGPIQASIANNDDGTVTLAFQGSPGAKYVVQSTPDLGSPSWSNISTNTAGTDGTWTTTQPMAGSPQIFYRAALVQ